MRQKSCKHISVFFLSAFFLFFSAYPLEAQSSPDSKQTAKPLIGEALLKTRIALQQEREKLQQEFEKTNQEILKINEEKTKIETFFDYVPYLNKLLSLSSIACVLVCCLWASLLLYMYGKIEKEQYALQKGFLKKLLIIFFIIGLIFIVCDIAGAESTGTPFPKRDLHATLEYARALPTMQSAQRVLNSLEEPACSRIDIPQDVMNLIASGCKESNLILNPILGNGLHRTAAIAAICWSLGDKNKALNLLAPATNQTFYNKNNEVFSFLMTALCLYVAQMDTVNVPKIVNQLMNSSDVDALIWAAKKTKTCCLSTALECLTKAASLANKPDEVFTVALTMRDFARYDEANKFLTNHIRLTQDVAVMRKFIIFVKEQGLDNIEQQILNYNIDWRTAPNSLVELAYAFHEMGYGSAAKRALEKAVEKESNSKGLIGIAELAIQWNHLELAKTTLEKVIDTEGADGAKLPFKDPLLLPVSREKPIDQNPSVGVVVGILSEKLGDMVNADLSYSEYLRIELNSCYVCQNPIGNINFTNFFYPYRFYVAHNRTDILPLLEPIGRDLENYYISWLQKTMKTNLEEELKSRQTELEKLKAELLKLKIKRVFRVLASSAFSIFSLAFLGVFIAAQIVSCRRMLEWIKRFDHLRVLGGVLKIIELEGFIFLASVIFSVFGLVLILVSQMSQAFLLTEAHTFRLSEHSRTGSGEGRPKLPMVYRD